MKTIKTALIFLICSIFAAFVFLFNYIYDDMDACMDTGTCKEGLSINIDGHQIIVSEKTCTEESGTWIKKRKTCQLKK